MIGWIPGHSCEFPRRVQSHAIVRQDLPPLSSQLQDHFHLQAESHDVSRQFKYTVLRWSLLSGYVAIRGMCTYLQHLMISDSAYELAALMCRREHGLRRSKERSSSKPKCV